MAEKEEIKKKKLSKAELEASLIENFVSLQKVLTNLSVKFDELSNNISKMLQLFEISAKTLIENSSAPSDSKSDKDLLYKLDSLLDQNKTIAKGIMLMEERIRQRSGSSLSPTQIQEGNIEARPKSFPKF